MNANTRNENAALPRPERISLVPVDSPEREAEAKRVAELSWPSTYAGIIPDAQVPYMIARMYSPEAIRADTAAGSPFYLVEADGVTAGVCSFDATKRGADGSAELHKIYLLPEWRGRGVGVRVLEEAKRRMKEEGAASVWLRVNKRNERAKRAYAAAGFRQAEALCTDIGGGFVMDDWVYRADLSGKGENAGGGLQGGTILLCGVGGQGILLAAKIAGAAAEAAGFDVVANEIHGMAQRGGSVRAFVKFGGKARSPLAVEGTVDVLAALEPVEALRWAHFLRPGGLAVANMHPVVPVTVSSGKAKYPADIDERLRRVFPRLVAYDCQRKAEEMGNAKLANTILVGMLSRGLPFSAETWRRAIAGSVKPAFEEINLAAFDFGRSLG
ncbi:MAG: GNAT family N-acetyltransferase [Kiritimatiellae bacterium]|nr:GNAT family N-acetyltransferase [Kiritimatiellia bacterium]